MQDIGWTKIGEDKRYGDKSFKVQNDKIYLSWNDKFEMGVNNFLICCANADDIPITNEHHTTSFEVGEDGGETVSISLTNDHDIGDEEQFAITKRDHGKWGSWVRFTIPELVNIVKSIRSYQQGEEPQLFNQQEDGQQQVLNQQEYSNQQDSSPQQNQSKSNEDDGNNDRSTGNKLSEHDIQMLYSDIEYQHKDFVDRGYVTQTEQQDDSGVRSMQDYNDKVRSGYYQSNPYEYGDNDSNQ